MSESGARHVRFMVPIAPDNPWYRKFMEDYEEAKKEGENGVMLVASSAEAIEEIAMDDLIVREKLDAFLAGVVKERCKQFGVDAMIEQILGRRVEVAVKAAVDAFAPRGIAEKVRAMIEAQVMQQLANFDIGVSVKVAPKP